MPYTDAVKEAYATVATNVVVYDTLQVSHPDIGTDLFFVNLLKGITATLEAAAGGGAQVFEPVPFAFVLPAKDGQGVPELSISIGNIGKEASDYVESVKDTHKPVTLTYRPYLSNDLTAPQLDPPLVLQVKDVQISLFTVDFRASFFDFKNTRFPNQHYARSRFPTLGQ